MSGVLVTPSGQLPQTRSQAVYDTVLQPQLAARLAERLRHISIPFTSIGANLLGPTVPAIRQGFVVAVSHELSAGDESARLFADVREKALSAGFDPPSYSVIARAAEWVQNLEEVVEAWSPPHVSSSPEGEIVLEWWRDPKKLTVYLSDAGVDYVESWGSSIRHEMAEGTANSTEEALTTWMWLTGG